MTCTGRQWRLRPMLAIYHIDTFLSKCLFNSNLAFLWPFYTVLYAQYSAPDSPSKTESYFLTSAKYVHRQDTTSLYTNTRHPPFWFISTAPFLFVPRITPLHLSCGSPTDP